MHEYDLIADITARLETEYSFKRKGEYLRGTCPDCRKPEAFTKAEQPYVVFCGRSNNCGNSNSARSLFPDLFENWSDRYPTTPDDPYATARAYLLHDRQFNLSILQNTWQQGAIPLRDGTFAETVKFPLWYNHYWQRIIDKRKIPLQKDPPGKRKKAKFSPGITYSGKCWIPPGMVLKKKDTVRIVEGIFHAIALWMYGYKAVAAFSCNNLPTEYIEQHKDLEIEWVLAYDNDTAGRSAALKFKQSLIDMKQRVAIDLAPAKNVDWDDCHRLGKIKDEQFWADCRYRGDLLQAESANQYAKIMYDHKPFTRRIFEYKNATHSINMDSGVYEVALQEGADPKTAFDKASKIIKISNCTHEFLYISRDDLADDQNYVFKLHYENGHPEQLIELPGSQIDSPSSLNKALLQRSAGGTFAGSSKDLQTLQNLWFNKIRTIQSIPFVGYDRTSKTYVYQTFAVREGRVIERNADGYFDLGKQGLKTNLKSPHINYSGEFSPEWVQDLWTAFGVKGLITLGFWTSTLFAQQIRSKYKSLPFFEVTGEPGAGKSTLIEILWAACGRDYEGFDPAKARPAAIRRTFNQVSNLPVVLIESDYNSEKNLHISQFTYDSIKPLYDGRGTGSIGVANRGNDTEEAMFQGAIIIAQNHEVHGQAALLERINAIRFSRAKRETIAPTQSLIQASKQESFASYLPHVIKQEKAWLELFEKNMADFEQRFWDAPLNSQNSNLIKNNRLVLNHLQLIAAVATLPMIFGQKYITADMINQAIAEVLQMMADRHDRIAGDDPLIEEFWETYHYINDKAPDYGKMPDNNESLNQEHRLNHSNSPETEIAINIPHFLDLCRTFNQPTFDPKKLKEKLPNSSRYPFIEKKKVRSRIKRSVINCFVFAIK